MESGSNRFSPVALAPPTQFFANNGNNGKGFIVGSKTSETLPNPFLCVSMAGRQLDGRRDRRVPRLRVELGAQPADAHVGRPQPGRLLQFVAGTGRTRPVNYRQDGHQEIKFPISEDLVSAQDFAVERQRELGAHGLLRTDGAADGVAVHLRADAGPALRAALRAVQRHAVGRHAARTQRRPGQT